MSKGIVPDGPIMTDLSDYDTPNHAEERRVRQMMCIRKKWTMALDGMGVRPFVCSVCGEEFSLDMEDERWNSMWRGERSVLPSVCLDCRPHELEDMYQKDNSRVNQLRISLLSFKYAYDNLKGLTLPDWIHGVIGLLNDISREELIALHDYGYCRCGIFIDSEGYECTETCLICIHYNYEMALHEKRHATMREEPWGDGCVKGVSR